MESSIDRVIFQYVKRRRNGRMEKKAILLAVADGPDKIKIGWSMCHPSEKSFDREVGYYIALGRALSKSSERLKVPHSLMDSLVTFGEKAHRRLTKKKDKKSNVMEAKFVMSPVVG